MKSHLLKLIVFGLVMAMVSWSAKQKKDPEIYPYAWLAGSWVGDGFGGRSEEIWSQPSPDGKMMGVYRHMDSTGTLTFYEFMVLDTSGLKLKHFTPDLVGWENKENFVAFEAIGFNSDKIILNGLIFERKTNDEIEIRLRLRRGEKIETEVFHMKRRG